MTNRIISHARNLQSINKDRYPYPYMTGYAYLFDISFMYKGQPVFSVQRGERLDYGPLKKHGIEYQHIKKYLAVGAFETCCSRLFCSYFLIEESKSEFGSLILHNNQKTVNIEQLTQKRVKLSIDQLKGRGIEAMAYIAPQNALLMLQIATGLDLVLQTNYTPKLDEFGLIIPPHFLRWEATTEGQKVEITHYYRPSELTGIIGWTISIRPEEAPES